MVIVVYNDHYFRSNHCQKEATFAADQLKQFIFVRAQVLNSKMDDWFYALKGGRVEVEMLENENECHQNIIDAIVKMYGLDIPRPPSGIEARKFRLIDIQTPQVFFNRPVYQHDILAKLEMVCSQPASGCLLVAGDGGIGKTTLVEKVISDKSNFDTFLNKLNIRMAIWTSCFEWRSLKQAQHQHQQTFPAKEQRTFAKRILAKINQRFENDRKFSRLVDFVNFFKDGNENVLFILDDVFNENLLQYFRQLLPETPMIAITRDHVPFTSALYQPVPLVAQVVKIQELSNADVKEMLSTCFNLGDKFSPKQV